MENKVLYEFCEFKLDIQNHTLTKNDERISITHKPFLLLKTLVENHGQIVTKDFLMQEVWNDTFVEESNITYTIRQLRIILGDDIHEPKYIETISKQGYRFIADITENKEDNETETNKNKSFYVFVGFISVILIALAYFQIKAFLNPKIQFENLKISFVTSNGKAYISAISSDGKFIAYVKDEIGKQSLWIRQKNETNDIQIVAAEKHEFWGITFSPDNQHIFYTAWKTNETDAALYKIPILGGLPKQILREIGGGISFSPDGNSFVYVSNFPSRGKSLLRIHDFISSETSDFAQRNHPKTFETDFSSPAWSPDGQKILAIGASNNMGEKHSLLEFDVESKESKEVLAKDWISLEKVIYQKNGKGLLMIARKNLEDLSQIWHFDFEKKEPRRITNDLNEYRSISITDDSNSVLTVKTEQITQLWLNEKNAFNLAKQIYSETGMKSGIEGFPFLPNGDLIARIGENGKDDIWRIETKTLKKERLTIDESENIHPTVSSDGETIVFSSNRNGLYQIWKTDKDGKNPQKVTNNETEPELFPHFSPKGDWIIFQQGWRKPNLWKVSTQGGNAIQLTKTTTIRPVISPNGKYFAYYYIDKTIWGLAVADLTTAEVIKKFPLPATVISRTVRWTSDGNALAYVNTENGVSNVWLQPLDSVAKQLTNYESERIFNFEWSADGKLFAITRGTINSNVVLLENN
jgi:Tol biopolymer transport system component/DNA-binding winged helix-turn-helix (wHTH) protein